MATQDDLLGLDYAYLGSPFADIASGDIDLGTMDYAYLGSPFVSNPLGTTTTNAISTFITVSWDDISTIMGVSKTNISSLLSTDVSV